MSDDIEAVWADLLLNSQRLLIGCVYRPPDDLSFFNKFEEKLDRIQPTRKNLVIVGDFNSDLIKVNRNEAAKPTGKKLLRILQSHGCKNLIKKPTRVTQTTKSIIDLIIVNNPSKVMTSGVLDLCIADHKLIYVTLKLKAKNPGFSIKKVRNYKNFDKQSFQRVLQESPWWITSIFDDLDDVTNAWDLLFKDILNAHIPTRMAKTRKESLPWMTSEIRKEMNRRYRLLKKCDGTAKTSNTWEEYKKSRNKVTKMLREAETAYWQKQFKNAKNPSDFWNLVNKIQNKNHNKHKRIGPLQQQHSSQEITTSNTEKAELINDYFVNIGSVLAENFHSDNEDNPAMLFHRVTPTIINPSSDTAKLASALSKIKPGKAAGPDEIHSKDLIAAEGSLINGLDIVFRKSFECSRFPTMWKLARVSAIFKKGNSLDPANYRPLSMLSLPGKLLESQFCSILDNHLQMHNIYSDNQWGFRKGRSTETLLLSMTERWRMALDNNKVIGAIFIDYRKAFDTVSHELLPHKLQAAGIMGNSYSWLLDYLNNRSQYTVVNGSKSATKNIRYGVPQGSLLGPRLYSIYVNDLPDAVSADGVVEMYADDTTAYCIGDNVDTVILLLNSVLKQICKWSKRNRLSIHLGKSEAMLISTSSFTGPLQELSYNSNSMEFVTSTRCLGVDIDCKLSWSRHIENLCKSYSKKLGALKRMSRLPSRTLEEIYFKTVLPGITYCISVWGGCTTPLFNKLEEIHAKAARYIHRIPSATDNFKVLKQANWHPLSYIYKKSLLKHVHQVYYQTAPTQIQDLFTLRKTKYKTRRSKQFEMERPNKEIARLSFKHRGTLLWNAMPDRVKNYENINTFKSHLKYIHKDINNFTFEKESSSILNKDECFHYY